MKTSLLLLPLILFVLTSCGADQIVHKDMSVQEVIEYFDRQNKHVVTFIGYSGAGYEDVDMMLQIAGKELDELNPSNTIINIGATPEGIGQIYEIARQRGFKTAGIVSTQALEYDAVPSEYVDEVFYIEDDTWGGYKDGTEILSPTSTAMISVSDEIVGIGGGEVGRDELDVAQKLGKVVRFYAADMNHQRAIDKAKEKGKPEPRDFRGAASRAQSVK